MIPGQRPKVHQAAMARSKAGVGGLHQPVAKPQQRRRTTGGTSPVKPMPTVTTQIPGVGSVTVPNPGGNKPAEAPPAPAPGGAGGHGGGYLKVRQKTPTGWKVVLMHRSKIKDVNSVMKNGLNGPAKPAASKPAPSGSSGSTSAPAPATGVEQPAAVPSWIPPMVGLGGLNANPLTGQIDWSKLVQAAGGVAATDATYASDLSAAIARAQETVAAPQSEITALTTANPVTGKTLYQTMYENALRKYGQASSSAMGSAAARGVGSSGMVNSSLGNLTAENANTTGELQQQYGNARVAALVNQITQALGSQDQDFSSAYYAALARAYGNMPQIGA